MKSYSALSKYKIGKCYGVFGLIYLMFLMHNSCGCYVTIKMHLMMMLINLRLFKVCIIFIIRLYYEQIVKHNDHTITLKNSIIKLRYIKI